MHATTVLLIEPGGCILAVSRGHDVTDWGLPGGWIEEGEAPAAAAARELKEETGIKVNPRHLRPVYEAGGCVTFVIDGPLFWPPALQSDPFEGHVAWATPEELGSSATFGRQQARMLRALRIHH